MKDYYSHAYAITPHDTNDNPADALYIGDGGTNGDLTVVMKGGAEVAFAGIPAGTLLPIAVVRVKATGTDVTDVVGLR